MTEKKSRLTDTMIKKIIEKNHDILVALADDTASMEAIVARDGCPFCKSHDYPCDCH